MIIVAIFTFFFTNKVLADYTIPSGTSVNGSTITAGQQSGVLTVNGTLYVDQNTVSLLGFTSVVINGPNGQIYWNGNYSLYFSAGITFVINNPTPGLQPTAGNGNGATRLYIGSTVIAVSSDNSQNGDFSFDQFNAAGGLPRFTLTSSTASPICYSATFTATLTPLNTTFDYDCLWSINTGSISPVTKVVKFNTPQTAIITPTISASAITYTITCIVYRNGDTNPLSTKTLTVTVNPLPTPVIVSGGGVSLCGTSTTLTANNGASGTIYYQGTLTNGTSTSTASPSQVVTSPGTYYFRAQIAATGCWGTQGSAVVAFHNLWTGTNSIDWNTSGNWSDNQLPSTTCPDVYIPPTLNQPILSNSPIATINNLHILTGATLTVKGIGTLQIAGAITNNGIFDVTNGTLVLNGTSTQTIDGSVLRNRNLKNLTISNNVNISNTLNDTLNILGTLAFGTSTTILNTNDNLTLKSSDTATANVGVMAAGNVINGNVIVERYIATGTTGAPNHGKSWQLLAIPVSGSQTIKQAWQEGATATNVSSPLAGSAGNPKAGYGTMLTSNVANAATQLNPGFDAFTSPGPSIKVYNPATNGYDGPASTGLSIYNKKGYFVFVRGDRSVNAFNAPSNPTVLRTKGTLFTPALAPPITNVAANLFESVGNPYASAIDMRNIVTTGGITEFIQVWDPRLGGGYNYGAFQTFYKIGNDYYVTPGGGSYGSTSIPSNYIQSGQAFFVQDFGLAGTVSIAENAKVGSSTLITAPNPLTQVQSVFRTNLNAVNSDGSTSLLDGVLSSFNDNFSNSVDGMDARKSLNTGENLSINSGGQLLAIERKQTVTKQDTIFFNLTGVRVQHYQFSFDAQNINPGIGAFLVDNYLNTRTPVSLSGNTLVNFNIENIPGSYAFNRFMIVFSPLKALAVTFTSIKAYLQGSNINVVWTVDNEINMKQYEVEKSNDGNNYTALGVKSAAANNGGSAAYTIADANPVAGYNYYRIKSVALNGENEFTNVVKVLVANLEPNISIYPNPITKGNIHLQLMNQPKGNYEIRLLNKLGQVIIDKQINHASGSSTELIKWDYNQSHGLYQLEVIKPDGNIKYINVLY